MYTFCRLKAKRHFAMEFEILYSRLFPMSVEVTSDTPKQTFYFVAVAECFELM
jgi:hypothetical protein